MAKPYNPSSFYYDKKYESAGEDYFDPNDELSYFDETTPYERNLFESISKRFYKKEKPEPIVEEPIPEDPIAPVVEQETVLATKEVKEDTREVIKEFKKAEAETGSTYTLSVFKKNKGVLAFSIVSAIIALALMVVMFFNVMVPQLSDVFMDGTQVVDITGSGSLFFVQGTMLAVAALLLITIIVGFVAVGGTKRHFMGVTAAIAFILLLLLGIFCAIGLKINSGIKFTDELINFKNPTTAYAYAAFLDIPCGYYLVLFFALLSFILSSFGYSKSQIKRLRTDYADYSNAQLFDEEGLPIADGELDVYGQPEEPADCADACCVQPEFYDFNN